MRCPSSVRFLLLVCAMVLGLAACDDPDAAVPAPSSRVPSLTLPARRSIAPVPAALTYATIATQAVPSDIRGIALYVHHVAYVEDESRLVLMDWRTGERRTVLESEYGALIPLQQHGQAEVRYLDVVDQQPGSARDDPAGPWRVLSVDLKTGRSATIDRRHDQVVIGEFNDASFELTRGEVVGVWQQPDPDLPHRAVTHTGGRIVQAAMAAHQLVWTESRDASGDLPATVWTWDLFRTDLPATRLARRGVPDNPVVGDGFAGWSDHGRHVLLVPTAGGDPVRLPGRLARGTRSAVDRHLVAMVLRSGGRLALTVYRVT